MLGYPIFYPKIFTQKSEFKTWEIVYTKIQNFYDNAKN